MQRKMATTREMVQTDGIRLKFGEEVEEEAATELNEENDVFMADARVFFWLDWLAISFGMKKLIVSSNCLLLCR